jgi:dTDP-4-amino-4,6-dideoxygalactose transaminase
LVPFLDLRAQYETIRGELEPAVLGVLERCEYALGPEVQEFEREFAAFCSAKHGVGVNSGTSALHLALIAAGVGPGDEVVTTPFTFVATVAAILYAGARPVLADVDPGSLTLDPGRFEAAITPRTKAVIPVHIHGHPADMDPIVEIARRSGITVIEDAAQAHAARYKEGPAGSLGDIACFSFYPGKNLGACGEGGMVVTDDVEIAHRVRMLRDWGQEKKYEHVMKGYNARLEGVQGAALRVKLRHLEAWTEARRERAALYNRLLTDAGVQTPTEMPWARHVYHVYAIRVPERDSIQARLQARGIQTGIHYPQPVHLLEGYRDLGYVRGDFPVAERSASETLSLPMYPELPLESVEEVARETAVAVRGLASV